MITSLDGTYLGRLHQQEVKNENTNNQARRLQGELKEAQTLYKIWDNKKWEAVINGLKEEK